MQVCALRTGVLISPQHNPCLGFSNGLFCRPNGVIGPLTGQSCKHRVLSTGGASKAGRVYDLLGPLRPLASVVFAGCSLISVCVYLVFRRFQVLWFWVPYRNALGTVLPGRSRVTSLHVGSIDLQVCVGVRPHPLCHALLWAVDGETSVAGGGSGATDGWRVQPVHAAVHDTPCPMESIIPSFCVAAEHVCIPWVTTGYPKYDVVG